MKKIIPIFFFLIFSLPLIGKDYEKICNVRNSYSELGNNNGIYMLILKTSSIYDKSATIVLGKNVDESIKSINFFLSELSHLKKYKAEKTIDLQGNNLILKKNKIFNRSYLEITTDGNKGSSSLTKGEMKKIARKLRKELKK